MAPALGYTALAAGGQQAVGLPGGVLIVLAQVGIDAAEVAVVDAVADGANRAGRDRMLVHLHVALGPMVFLNALIGHFADAEQGELAQGVTTAQTPALEVIGVAEPETLVPAAGQPAAISRFTAGVMISTALEATPRE